MASIQERKTKDGKTHFRVQIRLKGHPKVRKTFESKTKAKLWAQKTEIEIKDGLYFKSIEGAKHTLAETIERYEREVLPGKPRAKQGQNLKWWKEKLGEYRLSDISHSLISEHKDKLAQTITKTGTKIASTTILKYLACLSHVYTKAFEWGWVQESPLKRVSKPKIGQLRARFLSEEECQRLLLAAKASVNPYLYPAIVLSLATGMRKSELLTLTPNAVDVVNGRILLENTKNGERRNIFLRGHALAIMQELLKKKTLNMNYLFPSKNGTQPLDLRHPWEQALKVAKLDSHLKWHDLRHSAASFILMAGGTLAECAEVLGHKTLALVKRYGHISETHTAKVVERMNERIFGDVS